MFCSRGLSNQHFPPIQQFAYKACKYFIFFQIPLKKAIRFSRYTPPSSVAKQNILARRAMFKIWRCQHWRLSNKTPQGSKKNKIPSHSEDEFCHLPPTPTPLLNKVYKLFTCKQLEQEQLQLQATREDSAGSTGREKKGQGGAELPLHSKEPGLYTLPLQALPPENHRFRDIQHTTRYCKQWNIHAQEHSETESL